MPPGRRNKGRPRVRWEEGVEDAVEKRGVVIGDHKTSVMLT
jgi:hypothetical protein